MWSRDARVRCLSRLAPVTAMLVVRHPACKLSAVRFLDDPTDVQQRRFVTGSWEQLVNSLHLWSASRDGVRQLHRLTHEAGDVCAIQPLNGGLVATASSSGSLSVYYMDGEELKQVSERSVSKAVLTSLASADDGVISGGEDGVLSFLSVDKLSGPVKQQVVCDIPITCLDALSGSQVLCGNTAGSVKAVDSRSLNVASSLTNSSSPVVVVRRNPSNPHLIVSLPSCLLFPLTLTIVTGQACGTQSGSLCLWDVRKADSALLQLAAHSACVTELQYKENETNVIFSSALDGKLIRWNLLPTCEVTGAEAIVSPQSLAGPAITCFHLHRSFNELVLATDKEVLSYVTM